MAYLKIIVSGEQALSLSHQMLTLKMQTLSMKSNSRCAVANFTVSRKGNCLRSKTSCKKIQFITQTTQTSFISPPHKNTHQKGYIYNIKYTVIYKDSKAHKERNVNNLADNRAVHEKQFTVLLVWYGTPVDERSRSRCGSSTLNS